MSSKNRKESYKLQLSKVCTKIVDQTLYFNLAESLLRKWRSVGFSKKDHLKNHSSVKLSAQRMQNERSVTK